MRYLSTDITKKHTNKHVKQDVKINTSEQFNPHNTCYIK